jgi:hypothetical protein
VSLLRTIPGVAYQADRFRRRHLWPGLPSISAAARNLNHIAIERVTSNDQAANVFSR